MRYEVTPRNTNAAADVEVAALAQRLLDQIPDEVQDRITREAFRTAIRTGDVGAAEMVASELARDWLRSQRT